MKKLWLFLLEKNSKLVTNHQSALRYNETIMNLTVVHAGVDANCNTIEKCSYAQ